VRRKELKNTFRRSIVGILISCLLAGGPLAAQSAFASDETTQDAQETTGSIASGDVVNGEVPEATDTENGGSNEGTVGEQKTAEENVEDNEAAAETTEEQDNLGMQQELKENSWRYQDGELIQNSEPMLRTAAYAYAWQMVNGVYMNSAGNPIEGAVKKGIDVSEHQKKIDWNQVKADGIDFVIIRCGYGDDDASQDDKYWEYNVSECERLGIPYGVYLYSYATNTAMAQSEAAHVLRLISGRNLAYPVYFDMEDITTIGTSAEMKGKMAKAYCDTISAAGFKVGIYANTDWFNTKLTASEFNDSSWSKWVAQWNTTCDYAGAYDIWQCTDVGRVKGINANVDLSFLMNASIAPPEEITGGTTLAVRRGNTYHIKYSLSNGAADLEVPYGYASDEVLVGDWNGDGVDTLCVRRGNTYYFKDSLSPGEADKVVKYGKAGDEVYVGDWDGDGIDTLCVRRGNTYYIKNSFTNGEADIVVNYGKKGDTVLIGDWDGDGVDTVCVRRDKTYFFKNSLANGEADATIVYGRSSDSILVGDWNNDETDTLCVRRGNAYYIKNSIQEGEADKTVLYGRKDDITYAGKWK
jgi:GH25 family lysozyme M1 (1,4-beta-N-acetylmuramidase)